MYVNVCKPPAGVVQLSLRGLQRIAYFHISWQDAILHTFSVRELLLISAW